MEFGQATLGDAGCIGSSATCGGGNLYYLVAGPAGPVRGTGFAYELTYDVQNNGSSYQMYIHPDSNSVWFASVEYSPCPTEIEIIGDMIIGTLVPFY
ncbi:MAG TPA: hypothetical protein VH044_10415 [Polyangiaceae bacterium]|jgi:hypothetical protein|nr:hypothetical protein [Polyangiaceae bacterium]